MRKIHLIFLLEGRTVYHMTYADYAHARDYEQYSK